MGTLQTDTVLLRRDPISNTTTTGSGSISCRRALSQLMRV